MEEMTNEEIEREYQTLIDLRNDVDYNKDLSYLEMPSKYLEIIDKYKDYLDSDFVDELERNASEIESYNDYIKFIELIDERIDSINIEEVQSLEIDENLESGNPEDFIADAFENGMRNVVALGISAALITDMIPIALGNYASYLANSNLSTNGIILGFNSNNLMQISAIVATLSAIDNINLRLTNNDKEQFSKVIISSKDNKVSIDSLMSSINSSLDNNSNIIVDEATLNMIQLFDSSVRNNIPISMVMKNVDGEKKFGMAIDNPELVQYAQENGIKISDSGKIIFGNNKQASDFFSAMKGKVNDMGKDDFEIQVNSEEDIVLPGESKVDFYEKNIKDEYGQDITVRLSVVKQNKTDSNYERFANITYINKNTGEINSSSSVYTFTDAYMFDNDVLPELIASNGLNFNMALSGKNVDINEQDPTKCYLTGENDQQYSDRYSFDNHSSLIAMDDEKNIFGDSNGVINASRLKKDEVIDVMKQVDGIQFENDVTDTKENVETEDNEYVNSNNRVLQKKLGEYPTIVNSERGNANVLNLAFFLVIDIAAIAMGLFLLLR